MSYEHISNIKKKKIAMPIKIISIISLSLYIINIFFPQFLPSFFSVISKPFWDYKTDTVVSIELKNVMIDELRKENEYLKSALHRTATSSLIMANILKKPPFSAYDIYIIDIGKVEGVGVGDKVYALGHVLLGEIAESNNYSSKIKLYSSFGEKYEVLIGNNIQATAIGNGGGSFQVILPRDIKIREDDTVTIPNLSQSVFGIVRKVIADPAKTFATILFSQPVNIYEQKVVFVEKIK